MRPSVALRARQSKMATGKVAAAPSIDAQLNPKLPVNQERLTVAFIKGQGAHEFVPPVSFAFTVPI
ncbi:MAG TPA: hypothetical protein VGK48_18760 [Terriglobia bacterium]